MLIKTNESKPINIFQINHFYVVASKGRHPMLINSINPWADWYMPINIKQYVNTIFQKKTENVQKFMKIHFLGFSNPI